MVTSAMGSVARRSAYMTVSLPSSDTEAPPSSALTTSTAASSVSSVTVSDSSAVRL